MYKSKYILLIVKGNINKFIKKCLDYNINILNITYLNNDKVIIKINKDNYKKVIKLKYICEIKIYKYLGLDYIKRIIENNIFNLTVIIICFILMYLIENFIIKIEIYHSSNELINFVSKELEKNNIKPYTFKKDFDNLNQIKNKIIEDNPDKLEWMSITRKGMKYIVRIEERIIKNELKENKYCHIVAKKDGIVKSVISDKGEILVTENDYVKKGDILISGTIMVNEEIKENTCASGVVYGEVWYNIDLKIPLVHEEKKYTNKKRYNIIVNNKKLLKNKYKLYDETILKKINVFGLKIKIIKEKEYINLLKKYKTNEVLNEANKKIDEQLKIKLKDYQIINKKVLKKSIKNSTMNIEIFLVVLENISVEEPYTIEGEENVANFNSRLY